MPSEIEASILLSVLLSVASTTDIYAYLSQAFIMREAICATKSDVYEKCRCADDKIRNHDHDQVSIRAKTGLYYLVYHLLHISSHFNLTRTLGSVSSRHGQTGLLGHVCYTAKQSDSD